MELIGLLLAVVGGFSLMMYAFAAQKRRDEEEKLRGEKEKEKWNQLIDFTTDLSRRHMIALARKRRQLVRVDDYGQEILGAWEREIQYFIERVVTPEATLDGRWSREEIYNDAVRILLEQVIDSAVDLYLIETTAEDLSDVSSGVDYELLCKSILENAGWRVQKTAASGDQGADLIAERQGLRAVFQCKYYSSPVGNKAIQEAYAAEAHHEARFSAVVSNASFTPSARALASSCGVLLLHHEDLARLWDVIEKSLD